jgi:tetratricopeptide (TPR) repeat protein
VFEEREFDYICGELCDIPAIEKAIRFVIVVHNCTVIIIVYLGFCHSRTMKTGEVSEFTLSPKYGFGAAGNPEKNIPADSIVKYYIELHRFDVPKSPWRCTSTAETIQEARTRKEQGNAYFRMKEYDLAQTKYTKAQLFIECAEKDSWSPEELSRANEVKLHCSTNLAFVTLRNEEYDKTLVHCNNALDIDPNNLKALYRCAKVNCFFVFLPD